MNDDIVEQLREEGFVTHMARLPRESKILHAAADEIERLRRNTGCARNQRSTQFCAEALDAQREVARLTAERDEARKMCCELEARIIVLEEDRRDTSNKFGTNPCSEIILADSPLARYPKEIAKQKGWDCFKEEADHNNNYFKTHHK
jgi:hypothetical protein